jgi:hypothetical protein
LFGKAEKKRSLGTPRHRWGNNVRMDLREEVEWMHLAHDRTQRPALVDTVL